MSQVGRTFYRSSRVAQVVSVFAGLTFALMALAPSVDAEPSALVQAVAKALKDNGLREVVVDGDDEAITLRGFVGVRDDAVIAEHLVGSMPGVAKVINRIELRLAEGQPMRAATDEENVLAERAERELRSHGIHGVVVSVRESTATLTGRVDSHKDAIVAARALLHLPELKKIDDRLTLAVNSSAPTPTPRTQTIRATKTPVRSAKVELPKAEVATVSAAKVEPAKVESAKVEAAKVEAAKVEAAKVEAAKVEAAKVEAAKVEAAKVEAAKVEAAKVEAAKVAAAKVGAAKVEAAKVAAAKVAAAKVAAAKVEAAKVEAAKVEAAKVEAAKVEAAKLAAAKLAAAKVEAAKVEAAKVEAAKVEAAKVESAKVEAAKVEAAKVEAAKVAPTDGDTTTAAVDTSDVITRLRTSTMKACAGKHITFDTTGSSHPVTLAIREPSGDVKSHPVDQPWTPEVAGRYRIVAQAIAPDGRKGVPEEATIEVLPCYPTAALRIVKDELYVSEPLILDARGSMAEVGKIAYVEFEVTSDDATSYPPRRQTGPSEDIVELHEAGAYRVVARAFDDRGFSAPASASVTVLPRRSLFADVYGGSVRRSSDRVDRYVSGLVGVRLGLDLMVREHVAATASLGGFINFNDRSSSTVFLDAMVDRLFERFFLGVGAGALYLSDENRFTASLIVHGGKDLPWWLSRTPLQVMGEVRLLVDEIGDAEDNLAVWGGMRWHSRRTRKGLVDE